MQHTAANAPTPKKTKVFRAYCMLKEEERYYRETYTMAGGMRSLVGESLLKAHRALGRHILKHHLPGKLPVSVARQIIAEAGGCVEATVTARLKKLAAGPHICIQGRFLVLTEYPTLHGDEGAAQEEKERKRELNRLSQQRHRDKLKLQKQHNLPLDPTKATIKVPLKTLAAGPCPAGDGAKKKVVSKHTAALPVCLPQAANPEPTRLGGLAKKKGQAQSVVACQAAPGQDLVVGPAPTWQQQLAAMQAAHAQLPARATMGNNAPPRVAAPPPRAKAPAKPAAEPYVIPAAYRWQPLRWAWWQDVVAHQAIMAGANYKAFACLGASPQVLLDAIHLVAHASTTITNPPGAVYRAVQRLQAGVFQML